MAAKDSVGGIITCIVKSPEVGLGEPVFDKLEALLAHAMLSIPAARGFDFGSGFLGTRMRGSQHNDAFCRSAEQTHRLRTVTNRSGGIQARYQ